MADDITTDEESIEINLRQRVRVFDLSEDGSQWCERGIGQVTTHFKEKSNETFLLVHAEADDSLLLESKIQEDTAYQKQQGRFIIWAEDVNFLGLSFQENAGCDDIWETICKVQGKDPKADIGQDAVEKIIAEDENIEESTDIVEESAGNVATEVWFEEMLDIEHVELSAYERDVLEQLIELVNRLVSPTIEDKVPQPAESQLLDIFQMSDGIRETEGLQQLHETILYLLSLSRDKQ